VNQGTVGFLVGVGALLYNWKNAREMHDEFDWASIFFLVGIFIIIATVEKVGLLKDFADWMASTGLKSPAAYLAIFIWVSVLLSSFIDNVPYTVLMIPVCSYVATNLGVNPFVFYFGMLVGCGIGGNITPVGATANVLACGMLEKRGCKIELGKYMAMSVPFFRGAGDRRPSPAPADLVVMWMDKDSSVPALVYAGAISTSRTYLRF